MGFSFLFRMQVLRTPTHINNFLDPLKLYSSVYHGDFSREIKLPERKADSFLSFDVEDKNLWSYISISHTSSLLLLSKYRYNFNFILILISLFLFGAYTNFLFLNLLLFSNVHVTHNS